MKYKTSIRLAEFRVVHALLAGRRQGLEQTLHSASIAWRYTGLWLDWVPRKDLREPAAFPFAA